MRRFAALLLFLIPFMAIAGERPALGTGELPFSAIRGARLPKAGEWLEYVIAFPVDPLEKSIRDFIEPTAPSNNAPSAPEPLASGENTPLSQIYVIDREPVFEAPADWHSMRLRLEITSVDQDGCHAIMRYENRQDVVVIPFDVDPTGEKPIIDETEEPPADEDDVRGDAPVDPAQLDELFSGIIDEEERPEASVREFSSHWVGNRSISVEIERGGDMLEAFVRLSSRDVPFGVVRFATTDVDFVLVDHGVGIAPDFPLSEIHIEPEVGKLL